MTNVGRFRLMAWTGLTIVHRTVSVFPGDLLVDGEKSETFPSGSPQGGACMLRPMGGMGIGGTV
jgi:hypothetical protein